MLTCERCHPLDQTHNHTYLPNLNKRLLDEATDLRVKTHILYEDLSPLLRSGHYFPSQVLDMVDFLEHMLSA